MLNRLLVEGVSSIYSNQRASMAGVTPAQVRRDIMYIGYSGNPNRGYNMAALIESIGHSLDDPEGQRAALVGVGNLGRAILNYFSGRRPRLSIVAAFDNDPKKFDRIIQGCRCFSVDRVEEVKGIVNFAPIRLRVPSNVYVEDIDMAIIRIPYNYCL